MFRNVRALSITAKFLHHQRCISSSTAAICKISRAIYIRKYPVVVVLPDGSSFSVRHHEPREIIRLPLDLSTLTEAQRKARIDARKPRKKLLIQEDLQDNFRANKYLKYVQK